jgi:hypothetical protein
MQYKSIDTLKDSVINFNKVYKTLGKSDEQGPAAVRRHWENQMNKDQLL